MFQSLANYRYHVNQPGITISTNHILPSLGGGEARPSRICSPVEDPADDAVPLPGGIAAPLLPGMDLRRAGPVKADAKLSKKFNIG